MSDFSNQVVLITGASSGIGAALAREVASRGAHLVLAARRKDRLEKLASDLRKGGTRVLICPCDVTRDGDLEAVTKAAVQEFNRIDVVVANAGFGVVGLIDQLSLEDYRRQFETNVFGVLRTIYATLEQLKKSKGTLVLIGSVAGYIALPRSSPYSMSKFSIHALAQSISPELDQHGVSVVLIAPGFVESEIRQVDNFGVCHDKDPKPLPKWIEMSTVQAAKQIAAAVRARKSEGIITFHAKVLIRIKRYFPFLISLLVRKGLKARAQPSS